MTPRPVVWAAYTGSAYGQEITLHRTELAALDACATTLHADDGRSFTDEEDFREALDLHCQGRSDDWYVCEVSLPAPQRQPRGNRGSSHDNTTYFPARWHA